MKASRCLLDPRLGTWHESSQRGHGRHDGRVVACDRTGNVDLNDLEAKAAQHRDRLSALMLTYPSTHGVFEADVRRICQIVHTHGGQVYMDGANMNAQVGLCRPGDIGADVCHLNLHKTFLYPPWGRRAGHGTDRCGAHLAPFLPGHPVMRLGGTKSSDRSRQRLTAAPSILTISWVYIALMGRDGLTKATQVAILNANYMAKRLEKYYPILYTGNIRIRRARVHSRSAPVQGDARASKRWMWPSD